MRSRLMRNTIIYVVVAIVIIMVFYSFAAGSGGGEKSIASVIRMAQDGTVASIIIDGDSLTVITIEGQTYTSRRGG